MKKINIKLGDSPTYKRKSLNFVKRTWEWNLFEVILYIIGAIALVWFLSQFDIEIKPESKVQGYTETVVVEIPEQPVKPPVAPVEAIEPVEVALDPRIEQIHSYLVSYGSPIPGVATTIVEQSEMHGVNPYVITAIFCQESSCGKATSKGNSTGYGLTDSGKVGVTEFDNIYLGLEYMIEQFSKRYAVCDSDIQCISDKGYNTRDSWVKNVKYFYNNISE